MALRVADRATHDDRVLRTTRVVSAVIIPFLVLAFVVLYGWPRDTGAAVRLADQATADRAAPRLGLPRRRLLLRARRPGDSLAHHQGRFPAGRHVRDADGDRHDPALGEVHPLPRRLLALGRASTSRRRSSSPACGSPTAGSRTAHRRRRGPRPRADGTRHRRDRRARRGDERVPVPLPAAGDRRLAVDADAADRPGDGRDLRAGPGRRRAPSPSAGGAPTG